MSKVSMAKAAKMFAVSRPTLANHIKSGKISAEKIDDAWQIDMAELKRVYQPRGGKGDRSVHADLASVARQDEKELQGEIKLLQAKLDAAEKLLEERAQHLDDLRALLPGPDERRQGRKWWPF